LKVDNDDVVKIEAKLTKDDQYGKFVVRGQIEKLMKA
jgi:hypothetical protein